MPPTPQAVIFVLSELWSPVQTETFICQFWPPGVSPGHLRALLSAPPLDLVPYMDQLIDIATDLVLAGHQRSLVQVLQERGALPLISPLPPIEVFPIFYLSMEAVHFGPGVLSYSNCKLYLFCASGSTHSGIRDKKKKGLLCILGYSLSVLRNKKGGVTVFW